MSDMERAPRDIFIKGEYVIPVIKTTGPTGTGVQYVYRFGNGYGASVINHSGSYGVELAVVEWDDMFSDNDDYTLCYTTPVAGDVLGWLTFDELILKLGAIQELPNKPESYNEICDTEQ